MENLILGLGLVLRESELRPYDDVVQVRVEGEWLDYAAIKNSDDARAALALCQAPIHGEKTSGRGEQPLHRIRRSDRGAIQYLISLNVNQLQDVAGIPAGQSRSAFWKALEKSAEDWALANWQGEVLPLVQALSNEWQQYQDKSKQST